MGNPQDLMVEAEALDAFAAMSRDRAERFRSLGSTFHEAEVSRRAFGIMPASFAMSARYAELFESCLVGLRDAAEVMEDIAEGVRDMAATYTGTDVANRELFAPQPQTPGPYWAPGAPGSTPPAPSDSGYA